MYDAVSIKKFCHGAPDDKIQIRVKEDVFPRANELILKYAPKSELKKIREKRRSYINIPAPTNRCSVITADSCRVYLSCNIHPLFSDGYVLFTVKYGTGEEQKCLLDLDLDEKTFYQQNIRVSLEEAIKICNTCTKYDTKMEPRARDCYFKMIKQDVVLAGLMVNPNIPWLGFSPDGLVPNLKRIVEIKCPYKFKDLPVNEMIKKLSFIDTTGENYSLKEKHKYHCQVQLGMFIANVPRCDFVVYSAADNNCIIIPVYLDKTLVVDDYIPKLRQVFFKYMLTYLSHSAVTPSSVNPNCLW
ncbi:hypothetical protein QAD02_008438 [Eretmocerus hayati]|uniref:Uncharacterized protein n=1 Tax=Eretmocerus hayati TaxID=131215 RepID=A0ACC2N7W0_9HYME|nr:hypothetical protein QAD02_008438 [Eretmocerus hayati]